MRPLTSALLVLPVLSAGIFGFTGCTLFGYLIGSSIDNSTPDMEPVPDQKIQDIAHSAHLLVIKKDSTSIEGNLIRLDIVPPETALAWYSRQAESHPIDSLLPGFGQSITLKVNVEDGGPNCWGTLVGFDTWNIYWRDRSSARIMKTPFDRVIKLIYGVNRTIAGNDLPALIRQQGVPNIAAIWLHSGALIPLRDVARVEARVTKNAQTTWTLVGAAVDCAVLIGGAIALSQLHGLGGWGSSY